MTELGIESAGRERRDERVDPAGDRHQPFQMRRRIPIPVGMVGDDGQSLAQRLGQRC
jgi:hypothetical protein